MPVKNAPNQSNTQSLSHQQSLRWFTALALIAISLVFCSSLWTSLQANRLPQTSDKAEIRKDDKAAPGDLAAAAKIKVLCVSNQAPCFTFSATGTVEANQKRVQQVTPLVTGRVEDMLASTGSKVKKGDLLVVIQSPEVAEMHGKLHEAETREALAQTQLDRVMQAANRVNILKAKATLDEADATVKRERLLVSEGAAPKKELLAAESEWARSEAEYNFQKDISLNKDIAEAKSELRTAATEVEHLRDGLRVLDGFVTNNGEGNEHDIARIELRAPITGIVIERLANPGTGVAPGKALLTVADTSSVWVYANVPEKDLSQVAVDMPVQVAVSGKGLTGRVNFIDPRLNEDTRTARVRIELKDLKEQLETGSFADVTFKRTHPDKRALAFVPDGAIQDINGQSVVFVKKNSGEFAMRKVEIGPRCCNLVPVYKGLTAGENVAEDGSFILKSQMLKDQLEGDA